MSSRISTAADGRILPFRRISRLKDTVIPLNEFEGTGDGFSFMNYNGEDLINTINYSKYIFYDQPQHWAELVKHGMKKDLSWSVSKKEYEELYNALIAR